MNNLQELSYVYGSDYFISPKGRKIRINRLTFDSQEDDVRRLETAKKRKERLAAKVAARRERELYGGEEIKDKLKKDKIRQTVRTKMRTIRKKRVYYGDETANNIKKQNKEMEIRMNIKENLTPAQTAKREEIIRAMKKRKDYYKKMYGRDAEQIMYATATKIAIKSTSKPNIKESLNMNQKVETILEQIYDLDEASRMQLFDIAMQIEEELEIEEGQDQLSEASKVLAKKYKENEDDAECSDKEKKLKESNTLSYREFVNSINEYTSDEKGRYVHKGKSYGGSNTEKESDDNDDVQEKPKNTGIKSIIATKAAKAQEKGNK